MKAEQMRWVVIPKKMDYYLGAEYGAYARTGDVLIEEEGTEYHRVGSTRQEFWDAITATATYIVTNYRQVGIGGPVRDAAWETLDNLGVKLPELRTYQEE